MISTSLRFIFWLFITAYFVPTTSSAQVFNFFSNKEPETPRQMLLSDRAIQLGTNDAINNMYNFNFYEAEKDFKWLTVKYPNHPIGHFLLGLNEWWKIVPDLKVTRYDETCHEYMDLAIKKAEDLYDEDSRDKEAAFFLAAAYAFKGRLYSEREKWVKAASLSV